LLASKKPDAAITIYEEDLKFYPKNGWALNGLKAAYDALKETDKAKQVDEQFKAAWANADVALVHSVVK